MCNFREFTYEGHVFCYYRGGLVEKDWEWNHGGEEKYYEQHVTEVIKREKEDGTYYIKILFDIILLPFKLPLWILSWLIDKTNGTSKTEHFIAKEIDDLRRQALSDFGRIGDYIAELEWRLRQLEEDLEKRNRGV